jgi:hypothetical protein
MCVCVCVCGMPFELKGFYFCLEPPDGWHPTKGCGLAGRGWGWQPQCARASFPLPATASALGSCSQASGWGGAVRRGPAKEEEVEVKGGRGPTGPAPPMSCKAPVPGQGPSTPMPGKSHTLLPEPGWRRHSLSGMTCHMSSMVRSSHWP